MLTNKKIKTLFIVIISILFQNSYSQMDSCGTVPFSGETSSPSTFIGGRYKPHRTDIGGSQSGSDYFPILVVFIQYQGETGGNFPGNPDSVDAWPAGRAPNYLNRVIKASRTSTSSWWDSYNGYDISDYWHEFSRGKLHAIGEAYSVILPQTKAWYDANGGHAKMNKDVFDILQDPELGIDWPFYDKWTTIAEGDFKWEPDQLVDMIYLVFRSRANGYLGAAAGEASIGSIQGASTNGQYTVYQSGNIIVKVQGGGFGINCSGHRTEAPGNSIFSRHAFIGIGTHEHGHYLFGGAHETYCHMVSGAGGELSFSPWEMVKMGYIQPQTVNYFNPTHLLYDISSRNGTAGSAGEVLQIPISGENEFFLLANRRKVSQWDIRMAGDTLAEDGNYSLKKINPNYGKGLYIYHIKGGYEYGPGNAKDMDLECADGLWNWEFASLYRPPIWGPSGANPVFKRSTPSYSNDNPANFDTPSLLNRDEISFFYRLNDTGRTIWFSPGSRDLFSPTRRGTDRIYTNTKDYWFSLPVYGDRWDAWNVGYNEVFSPYSSPNTRKMNNDTCGIFIWYQAVDTSTKEAILKLYRSGQGGFTRDSILHLTPPSKPMGMVADYHLEGENIMRPIITWNHNQEPDMLRTNLKKKYKIWRATQLNMYYVPTNYLFLDTLSIDSGTIPSYIDTSIIAWGSAWPGMGAQTEYPVRYRVQAIDKWGDSSVRSDFGSVIGLMNCSICAVGDGPDNIAKDIPDQYFLYSNYPNPFNPETKIKFDLPIDNFVSIKVYDVLGKVVYTLVNEFKQAGRYSVSFNGSNISSGIYYYKITAGNFEQVRKMILIK